DNEECLLLMLPEEREHAHVATLQQRERAGPQRRVDLTRLTPFAIDREDAVRIVRLCLDVQFLPPGLHFRIGCTGGKATSGLAGLLHRRPELWIRLVARHPDLFAVIDERRPWERQQHHRADA